MTVIKTVYVPSIVITDKSFPLFDNEYQKICAKKDWELSHKQAVEWVKHQTRVLTKCKHDYEVQMKTYNVLAEDY